MTSIIDITFATLHSLLADWSQDGTELRETAQVEAELWIAGAPARFRDGHARAQHRHDQ